MERMTEMLTAAIVESARVAPISGGLAGYALVVDSDIVSVGGVVMLRAFADDPANQWALLSPVDWPPQPASPLFEEVSSLLGGLPVAPYDRRARLAVDAMVKALEAARAVEPSLRGVPLLIICADGGGIWNELEGEAVRRLNDDDVYERWVRAR